jgi:hypothetical protein
MKNCITFYLFLSVKWVQDHWQISAIWQKPGTTTLPDENLCNRRMYCQIKILVLCVSVEKNEEDEWYSQWLSYWISLLIKCFKVLCYIHNSLHTKSSKLRECACQIGNCNIFSIGHIQIKHFMSKLIQYDNHWEWCSFVSFTSIVIFSVKPVLRGHLWDKENVPL